MKEADCFPGRRIGRLTLLYPVRIPSGRYTRGGWYCKCVCGRYRVTRTDSLGDGIISCGCFNKENWDSIHNNQRKEINDLSDWNYRSPYHKIREVFRHMHERCDNPNNSQYEDYGGRGISICTDWYDYEKFKSWMINAGYDINKPSKEQTLDRIDFNGNYEPANCRLVDLFVQANNKRNNDVVTYRGKTQTIAQWARELKIPYGTLQHRYKAMGWRGSKLFQPVLKTKKKEAK